jgi:hypothetical protein
MMGFEQLRAEEHEEFEAVSVSFETGANPRSFFSSSFISSLGWRGFSPAMLGEEGGRGEQPKKPQSLVLCVVA